MKELDNNELTFMLCATGYLPPRTEEEDIFFEQMYEDYKPQFKDRHIDIDAIVAGHCTFSSPDYINGVIKEKNNRLNVEETAHMAARNFNTLSKDIIEKIKNQHKHKR